MFPVQGKWLASVKTNIHERDKREYFKEARNLVKKNIILPKGYYLNWLLPCLRADNFSDRSAGE
jgi:hypothetical protein